jgi:hypothetical protein
MALEGGAKLEVTLKSMARKMTSGSVSAGIYDSDLAQKAYWNEYGHVNEDGSIIPPRPFMRTTFEHRHQEWLNILRAELRDGRTTNEALKETGKYMADNIRVTLLNAPFLFKANRPRTIRRKGFDYALLETGATRKAVSYRVEKVSR